MPDDPTDEAYRPSDDELGAEVVRLRAENAELRTRVAQLEALVDEVRRGGKRQAAPFSRGTTKAAPKRPGRKAGPDHGVRARRPVPARADATVEVPAPAACSACGEAVEATGTADQWVEDLPAPATVVTRYRVGIGRCSACGARAQGRHPDQVSDALGAAGSQVGPRALALAAELNKVGGLSLAKTARVLARLGLSLTSGGLSQGLARLARRAEATYAALRAEVAASPVVAPDETGWRVGGLSAWLWAFATPTLAVYAIAPGRGFAQATAVLPADYAGTVVRDGWAPYRKFTSATHQSCLAHLLRRCAELRETLATKDWVVPVEVAGILTDALATRNRRDAGGLESEKLRRVLDDLDARVGRVLRRAPTHEANRRLLKHLGNERGALFTFVADPRVDATNFRAEQAIRPAVVNRKTWGGNRTWRGAHTQEVLTSVLRTATLQGADAIGLLGALLCSPAPVVAPLDLPLTAGPAPPG